jgi:hypothetical protein
MAFSVDYKMKERKVRKRNTQKENSRKGRKAEKKNE